MASNNRVNELRELYGYEQREHYDGPRHKRKSRWGTHRRNRRREICRPPRHFAPWTPDEEQNVMEMYRGGLPYTEIGKVVGRSRGAIAARLKMLGWKRAQGQDQKGGALMKQAEKWEFVDKFADKMRRKYHRRYRPDEVYDLLAEAGYFRLAAERKRVTERVEQMKQVPTGKDLDGDLCAECLKRNRIASLMLLAMRGDRLD